MSDFVTFYAPCPVIGSGTSDDPRRLTVWIKVDTLMDLIDAGLLCWNSDGTANNLANERMFTEELVADFGIVGVSKMTLTPSIHKMIVEWQEQRYDIPPVQAPSLKELKQKAQAVKGMLLLRLDKHGVKLPDGENATARVLDWMESATVPVIARPLRNYYRDVLRGGGRSTGDMPSFLANDDSSPGVDPVKFAAMKKRIDGAGDTNAFRFLHSMFEIAYLDVLVRNL